MRPLRTSPDYDSTGSTVTAPAAHDERSPASAQKYFIHQVGRLGNIAPTLSSKITLPLRQAGSVRPDPTTCCTTGTTHAFLPCSGYDGRYARTTPPSPQ